MAESGGGSVGGVIDKWTEAWWDVVGWGAIVWWVDVVGGCMCRYDEAPAEQKPYRQKDGGLLAVGALNDKLKHTEPYKSQLEHMLVTHVYPEFSSPAGHLRAKVHA